MKNRIEKKCRNAELTKSKILESAKEAFAEHGYTGATIRDVAFRAGVTSPMLLHYYGSKIGLYEAALRNAVSTQPFFNVNRETFAENYVKQITDPALDSNPSLRPGLGGMIVLSVGDNEARAVTARVLKQYALTPLKEWLGSPDAEARAVEITMLTVSYGLFSRQIPLFPRNETTHDVIVDWMIETIHQIVNR